MVNYDGNAPMYWARQEQLEYYPSFCHFESLTQSGKFLEFSKYYILRDK